MSNKELKVVFYSVPSNWYLDFMDLLVCEDIGGREILVGDLPDIVDPNKVPLETRCRIGWQESSYSAIDEVKDSDAVIYTVSPKLMQGNNWLKQLKDQGYQGKTIFVKLPGQDYQNANLKSADHVFNLGQKGLVSEITKILRDL